MPSLVERLIGCIGRVTDAGSVHLRIGEDSTTWRHPSTTADSDEPLAQQTPAASANFSGPNGEEGELKIANPLTNETFVNEEILEIAALIIEDVADRRAEQAAADAVAQQLFESEQRLAETLIRLEESNRQLEQFAYIAAHELLHPLRAVTAFSDLLPDLIAAENGDAVESCAARIREGIRSMQKQLTELLKLSAVSTDAVELEVVDLHQPAHTAIDALHDQLGSIDAHVSIEKLPSVKGQAVQLQSIFHNLLANSIRYRSADRPLRIAVIGQVSATESVVVFEDNGAGIDAADAERVFGVFERASTHEDGFGIGLALSRRIMEHFGGTISIDPSLEIGTRFVLRFPPLAAA